MTTRQNVADAVADVHTQVELLKMTNPHINLRPLAESVALAEQVLAELDEAVPFVAETDQGPATGEPTTGQTEPQPVDENGEPAAPTPEPEPVEKPTPHKAAHHTTKKTAHKA